VNVSCHHLPASTYHLIDLSTFICHVDKAIERLEADIATTVNEHHETILCQIQVEQERRQRQQAIQERLTRLESDIEHTLNHPDGVFAQYRAEKAAVEAEQERQRWLKHCEDGEKQWIHWSTVVDEVEQMAKSCLVDGLKDTFDKVQGALDDWDAWKGRDMQIRQQQHQDRAGDVVVSADEEEAMRERSNNLPTVLQTMLEDVFRDSMSIRTENADNDRNVLVYFELKLDHYRTDQLVETLTFFNSMNKAVASSLKRIYSSIVLPIVSGQSIDVVREGERGIKCLHYSPDTEWEDEQNTEPKELFGEFCLLKHDFVQVRFRLLFMHV
jgi:hypothetical protein